MKISVLTIFPEMLQGFVNASLVAKAIARDLIGIELVQIRDFADPPHFQVDDSPYGGGAGMVMRPEPLARAIEHAKSRHQAPHVVLLSPVGMPFTQAKAEQLARRSDLVLVCGRYEGVDQRVIDTLVDEEISLGDFVLMGGEVAAMAVIEATVRLVDRVVGNAESIQHESFSERPQGRLLEAPHYTRPAVFRGISVPEVLLSGNHAAIDRWRLEQSIERTRRRRPDLIEEE